MDKEEYNINRNKGFYHQGYKEGAKAEAENFLKITRKIFNKYYERFKENPVMGNRFSELLYEIERELKQKHSGEKD